MLNLMLPLALLIGAAAIGVVFWQLLGLAKKVKPSSREHMDPLPPFLKLIWRPINFLQHHVLAIAPTSVLLRRRRQLQLAGMEYLLRSEEFISLQLVSGLIFAAISYFCSLMLNATSLNAALATIVLGIFGWSYPALWMSDRKKKRDKEVFRALPNYLDMITLCCQGGLGLSSALQHAVAKGPKGALNNELDRVLRDMRAGLTRVEALKMLADRMGNKHITTLVSNIVQAETLGASMADTLAAIAEQRRIERFQYAEKLAMEAPVKMLGPLIIFIFPVTFLILFFPIVMQFLENNN